MICRDGKCRGFIQDFDYGMNWKSLLADLGLDFDLAEWSRFVKEELDKMRQDLLDQDSNSDSGDFESGSAEDEFEDDDDDDESDENDESGDGRSEGDDDEDEEYTEAEGEERGDDGSSEVPEGASISDEGKVPDIKPLSPEELRLKCKQRTVRHDDSYSLHSCTKATDAGHSILHGRGYHPRECCARSAP